MPSQVDNRLREPGGYTLARQALDSMERSGIWPTALNFELWIHFLAEPDSPLGHEIQRMLSAGEAFTETVADALAALYLPKIKLNEQIRDAGDQLSKELTSVSGVIASAQKSSAAYGVTLAEAARTFAAGTDDLQALGAAVSAMSEATALVQSENQDLEKRLAQSSAEVARLRDHLEQVRRDATTDGLTNLANRKTFDEELERACAEADAAGQRMTLALIDIDHFKLFNDNWGHQTGDQVLRYVASVIGRLGAPPRFAARYGGEEFAMLLPADTPEAAFALLDEIRLEIASRKLKRRSTDEDLGTITISAGMARREPGESPHQLMGRADAALYKSKRSGRNRITDADQGAKAA